MATARVIVSDALTFHLNRLSPGETLDADTAAVCLRALNSIVDELDGAKGLLWREKLTQSGAITGTTATLGTDWTGVAAGDLILGATLNYSSSIDLPLSVMTLEQYQSLVIKTFASNIPQAIAHDGYATVYVYPAATGQRITLRTKAPVATFADLDTDYGMPAGYQSGFAALLAEKMAPTLAPEMLGAATAAARKARARLSAQSMTPAILSVSAGRTAGGLAGFLAGN